MRRSISMPSLSPHTGSNTASPHGSKCPGAIGSFLARPWPQIALSVHPFVLDARWTQTPA
jgi:hypothetical protein